VVVRRWVATINDLDGEYITGREVLGGSAVRELESESVVAGFVDI
jgi:hypothetical protein